ncbi:MAG: metal ABC transporter permease [Chitinispirillaceae bacterium]|nr:metal ABC transporter permease [Chitinispirillaceae bacterium]
MVDAVQFAFMQNALAAGLLAAVACGIVGTLVVVNRLSFIAGGVAHAAYGGLGVAVFFGLPPAAGTLPFSIASSLVMGYAAGRNRERSDAVVGAMWAAGMAIGIILIELTPGYQADLMSYLFGSIMAVSGTDLLLMALLDAVIAGAVFLFYKEILAVSYDEEFAAISGVPVAAIRYLLLAMIACTVVMLIQAVGLILVIALFTIPASIAELLSKNLRSMMVIAIGAGAGSTVCGLFVSYFLNLTAGATIIMVACVAYGMVYIATRSGMKVGKRKGG